MRLDRSMHFINRHAAPAVDDKVALLAVARSHVHADRPLAVELRASEVLELS